MIIGRNEKRCAEDNHNYRLTIMCMRKGNFRLELSLPQISHIHKTHNFKYRPNWNFSDQMNLQAQFLFRFFVDVHA